MNRIFRVIWNGVLANWVVVAESVATHGKSLSQRVAAAGDDPCGQVRQRSRGRGLLLCLISVLVCAAWQTAWAQPAVNALPTGGTVSAGQATISQSGNRMQILQGSDKAALNWQSFDIGQSAGVTFAQPSAQSVALNRVAGNDPSQIFGSLSANGKLILINPNGVVFGAGSRVDTAGLIATTKALSDADFMNGHYHFAGSGSGAVRNDGTLIAAPDGAILLIADKVINTGTVQVLGGVVDLFSADDLQVSANWTTADVAHAANVDRNTITVENAGRIDASGAQGGRILLDGGQGTVQSGGELLAIGRQGGGGSIHLSGLQVGLMQGSLTNAAGVTGGGEVLVGGDWQGSGSMAHAAATYMDADAVISVNATGQGDGGRAVLWSDGYTNFRGLIQANGAGSGNGGMVETSGKDVLDATGGVAMQGRQAGSWLMDPTNVTIATTGVTLPGTTYTPTTSGTISNTSINAALSAGGNVVISTAGGTDGNGVILQMANAPIDMGGAGNVTLSLLAGRIIDLQGNTGVSGTGSLSLTMNAGADGAVILRGNLDTNGGNVRFNSGVMVIGNATRSITTRGGFVRIDGDLEINAPGLLIDTATGAANGGAVSFLGKVDSGDSYTYASPGGTWIDLNTFATNGNGTTPGSTFMAQPLTALENSYINYVSGFNIIALGGTYTNGAWRWANGVFAGQAFNATADTQMASTLPNGDTAYINWTGNEPRTVNGTNIYLTSLESGQWFARTSTTTPAGTVVQLVTNPSVLTVDAGNGSVSFANRVGSIKPLSSLTVTGPTAINGKQITTDLDQIYISPVSLGTTATVLESKAGSVIALAPISYGMNTAGTLTIRAADDISLDGPTSATANGSLLVDLTADTNNTGIGSITTGAIFTNAGDVVATNGGNIVMRASSGIMLVGGALDTGTGRGGSITLRNSRSGDIVATAGASLHAGTNGIIVTNGATVGVAGNGSITLDSLDAATISIANNFGDVAAGAPAITLNGAATGGTVRIISQSGDIQVNADINATAANNPSAIIVAADAPRLAADGTGGNVKLNNSNLTVDPTSRAIIYTGSVDDSTGIGSAGVGYPGPGRFRYNVAYNEIARLPAGSTGVYVQYREQPTLTINIATPIKVYDGITFNAQDWDNYTNTTGWKNNDNEASDPLNGNLAFNGNTTTVAKDVNTYTVGLGQLTDTLGYRLDITGSPTYEITPRHITVGDLIVATRKYDSTTDALITGGTLIGLVPGEENLVTLFGTHGVFEDKNVGVNKNVLVARVDLEGPGHANYTVDFPGSTTTGTIERAELRLTGIHPLDRVYDGTTNATFTGTPELTGIFASDMGQVSAPLDRISGRFENKNAGTLKEVVEDLSTAILFGTESGNYELVGVDQTVNSATIFPAPLQLIGVSAQKMFDGTNDAFMSATVKGLLAGDSIGDVRQFFSSVVPGKNKLLSILADFAIMDGNNGNNYQIIDDDLAATGEIKPIPSPSGMGNNRRAPESINENLLSALQVAVNFLQKFEQADYFLHPGDEVKISSTHATAGKVD